MNRIEHNETKWIFPFVEYSPNGMSEKLPLIIQLHGAGERGNGGDELERVDVHGFSKVVKNADHKCIFIMPQCPTGTFWAARVESILKFIEQIMSEYPVDENRVYLTGLSMGGFGTWYTAMAAPEKFAAIVPVCGGGMSWNTGCLNMPIWVFHGSDDKVVPPVQSDEMVAALRARDKDVTYTRIDGVAHNVWDYAYNEELLAWLLGKVRK